MHHRNKSVATKKTWRLNTAAILESPKQLRERIKQRRYAILIKILSLITLPLISKAENTKKTFATLIDFCTKMAKVCLFVLLERQPGLLTKSSPHVIATCGVNRGGFSLCAAIFVLLTIGLPQVDEWRVKLVQGD